MRLLVIEDHRAMRNVIANYFCDRGFAAAAAGRGEDALAAAATVAYDAGYAVKSPHEIIGRRSTVLVWVIGIGFALLLFAASPRHAIAAALVVTLSLSAVYLYFRYLSQVEAENRRNLITDITYDPGKCPNDTPLYFLFKNLSNRSVESISFQIKAYQNHSNELKSGGVHTLSKLIAPSQIYTSCLSLPSDISTTAELGTFRWTTSIFLVIWR